MWPLLIGLGVIVVALLAALCWYAFKTFRNL